ncbi:hypothetical protein EYF80_060720 [Liparis tanakae]|uniref:Uncharacterized protein n=1 Tax=Liparis tanakae TaxID=230148 RepID=A0A4Z2EL92_9TELE|nr:hypothetical protein EYF80_060720 [Liparis tanakae]
MNEPFLNPPSLGSSRKFKVPARGTRRSHRRDVQVNDKTSHLLLITSSAERLKIKATETDSENRPCSDSPAAIHL